MAEIFDNRLCELGEGPLWHPGRAQLFWCDILGKRLLTRTEAGPQDWAFDRHISTAGWIDDATLMIATETDLIRFDIATGAQERIAPLEADSPNTRSNDGRADPQGGFWIGTMGKAAEAEAGAIYRYYRGELRQLFPRISIPNGIAFDPAGDLAYFADSAPGRVWRQALGTDGWPSGAPELFLDHGPDSIAPDGAVVDADGLYWSAEWGNFRVAAYDRSGSLVREIPVPARQPSCPAFGGADLRTVFITTAREGLGEGATAHDGPTYTVADIAQGQTEHRVIL